MRPVQRSRTSLLQFSAEANRYDRMAYRRCGVSGLKLPAIALGAWETFGGYRGPEMTRDCIFGAFNLGITHFDLTARDGHYYLRASGAGRAELREAVETMPRHIREPLRDAGPVQDTLDSLFEVQERLFRWRFPDWDDTEPDDFDYAS